MRHQEVLGEVFLAVVTYSRTGVSWVLHSARQDVANVVERAADVAPLLDNSGGAVDGVEFLHTLGVEFFQLFHRRRV